MFETEIKGVKLVLETSPELFSPSSADSGTLAMLSRAEFKPDDRVLDLGCGCGLVGITAAKLIGAENVALCDISPKAVEISRKNAELNGVPELKVYLSNGLSGVPAGDFTLILSNPPYHADFSVPKRFIEEGFGRLAVGGRMVMVTKRLDWYKNKLAAVFGGVRTEEVNGYFVFTAEKRSERPPRREKSRGGLSKKLLKKQKSRKKIKIRDV